MNQVGDDCCCGQLSASWYCKDSRRGLVPDTVHGMPSNRGDVLDAFVCLAVQ